MVSKSQILKLELAAAEKAKTFKSPDQIERAKRLRNMSSDELMEEYLRSCETVDPAVAAKYAGLSEQELTDLYLQSCKGL